MPYFQRAHYATFATLFIAYSGFYLCRTNLSVATPLLIAAEGLDKAALGGLASLGVVFYGAGKLLNGVLGDFWGGKRVLVLGMVGSVVATVMFGLGSGLAWFTVWWAANRLIQSMGWGGLVKIAAQWSHYQAYGRVMAWLSLSFLFGDFVARLWLGWLIKLGLSWQSLFFAAAGLFAGLAALAAWLLHERPEHRGLPAPEANPANLHAGTEARLSLGALLRPYLRSPRFGMVLAMSFGLTAIREVLNFWLPTYLVEAAGLSKGDASQWSSLFPLFGMVSILVTGYASDRPGGRALLIGTACAALVGVFWLLGLPHQGFVLPLGLLAMAGLLVLGPFSLLGGALAIDLGGPRGAASAAGLIDAVGYAGSSVALWAVGQLAGGPQGWASAFWILAGLAAFTALAAWGFSRAG
ncbi:MAG: MFS transporter [Bernardetiaceae bacterium]|jgi:OPA family glycerol-3-phosphate transporter-like MFS transporter|nr:MFS transporter [Bernardetiaceae bacterium]